ncbi:SpvB/TcaC N-terminal domain-containing protein [Leptothoe sp. ISB3NOV94-8A]
MAQTIATSSDIVSLPSGGGQLAGLGETFQPNLYTGTGNYSIPISCPPGINGLKPELILGYTTGGGNGPFGMGFQLGVLSISRATQKGIPKYRNTSSSTDKEQFQFSGAQNLIDCGNNRYRPKFDQTFWLIERKKEHWEVTTKDGSVHYLGTTSNSKVSNSDRRRTRVFSWLLDRMVDPNGNEIQYSYLEDESQRYVESISYGPFEILIDYIDTRPDPFISRRAGFVIETRFRAQRIRVISHRNGTRELRRYELEYEEPIPRKLSLLKRVTMAAGTGNNYVVMPTVTFDYSKLSYEKQDAITFTSRDGLVPPNLTNPNISLVDLTGDGLPDFVTSDEFSLSYWRNLGNGQWAAPTPLAGVSTQIQLGAPTVQFADLEGNGTADLLIGSNLSGYFPNAASADWENPIIYENGFSLPFDLTDPNLRLVDIDGDGRVDAIYSDSDSFQIFFNRGREGWKQEAQVVRREFNDSEWPNVFFSDDRIRFADMTGDGLMDIVMVDSGEIFYWPNLGYGNWGARVSMDASPIFPRNFKKEYLYLVDIDADGSADLVYIDEERDSIQIWLNHEGRYFGEVILIDGLPSLMGAKVLFLDMLAHGRPGVLISYPDRNSQYIYIELGSNSAPFLMTQIDNGLGGITKINYEPVEHFRQGDRMENRDWNSLLPFPMHVISSIEVEDYWTKKKAVTKFGYKNGHYDGEKREFQGFAEVEEREEGDEWSPTVKRNYNFHVGADLTKNEAQRRDTPNRTKERLRSLSGKELKRSVFQVMDGEEPDIEKDRIENTWSVSVSENTENGNIYFPNLSEGKTIAFADNNQHKVNITRNLRYDRDGNILSREVIGGRQRDESFQQELYLKEDFLYASSPQRLDGWQAQALCESKISDEEENLLSLTRTYFDGNFFEGLPLGEMNLGNISRIEELVYDQDITNIFANVDPSAAGYYQSDVNGVSKWFRNKIRYKWATDGKIEEIMGPRDEILQVEYDSYGIHPIRSINALGHTTELSIDDNVEAIQEVKHPSGYIDSRKYDALGRVVLQIRKEDDEGQHIYRAVWYQIGRLCGHNACPPSITILVPRERIEGESGLPNINTPLENQPKVIIQRVFYNGFGRELQRRVSAEPDEQGNRRVSVSATRWYNKRGFLYAQGEPYFSNSFEYKIPVSPEETSVSFEFHRDYLGRVINANRIGVGSRLTQYSPWKITGWDEEDSALKAKPTREEYLDSWNRKIEVREYENLDTYRKTTYKYDPTNNLKAVFDNLDHCTLELNHDYLGRRVSITQCDSGTRRYFLNSGGKVVESISPIGTNFVNTYDPINRVVEISSRSDAGALTTHRRFWYDNNPDDMAQPNLLGRLAQVEDEAGHIIYEYNLAGLNTSKKREFSDNRTFETRTEYDILLNISAFTYPNGIKIHYEYNESNLIQSIPNVINKILYSIKGQPTKVIFTNGVKEIHEYDEVCRLVKFDVKGSNNEVIFSQKYQYNEGLDVVRLEENFETETNLFVFEYDGLKQLTKVAGSNEESFFEYDSVGNILRNSQLGDDLFEYNDSQHPNVLTSQPSSDGSTSNIYDVAGRLVSSGKFNQIEYDDFDRLQHIKRSDGVDIEFRFGHETGRVLKRVISHPLPVKETFYFDEIYEQTENKSKAHILISGALIASIEKDESGQDTLEIYHKDRLGSTRCITGDDGKIKDRQENTTFGLSLPSGFPVKSFIGRDFDEDTGLIFLGTRFYDPSIGRFIMPDEEVIADPLKFLSAPVHYNPYAYSANNPVRYRDPNGRFAIVAAIVVGAAIGGYLGYQSAKEQGHNPWTGALIGGLIGGITAGYGGYLGGAAVAWEVVSAGVSGALLSAGVSAGTSYLTGGSYENIWTSAAIGFAFGAVGFTVGDWQPVVSGQGPWVNTQNIALEIAYDAGKGALYGATFSAVTGDDIQDGFEDGAVKGGLLSAAKIAFLGIMYSPISSDNRYEITHQYGWTSHNADNSHLAPQMRSHEGLPNLSGVRFRRYGLIHNIIGENTSIVLGNNVSMSEGAHYNVNVLAHEIRHIHQQQLLNLGSLEFYARYAMQWAFSAGWQHRYANHPGNDTYETPL